MDVYITEKESGRKVQIPALPGNGFQAGAEGRFAVYDIMNKGPVEVPDGQNLESVTWEAMFPGEARKNEPWIRKWTDPLELDKIFTDWREREPLLKLVITDTNINMDCYLASYLPTPFGGYGDINYSVVFREKADIVVTSTTVKKQSSSSGSGSGSGKTYTIKKGDCLWNISKSFYGKGAQWKKIYDANKSIIDAEAKRRGRKDSNNGWWIYPGTVITIP